MDKITDAHGDTKEAFSPEFRRIIAVDFDGVLHDDGCGWKGPAVILGPAVPGAINWLSGLLRARNDEGKLILDVRIFSSRCRSPEGIEAMKVWLGNQGLGLKDLAELHFAVEKPPAWVTIDDRVFRFEGRYPTLAWLLEFNSWTRRMPTGDAEFLREHARSLVLPDHMPDEAAFNETVRRLRGIADWMEGLFLARQDG
jgi:hypothetical protein